MITDEKKVSYQTTNTYSTKNKLTNATKNVWFCCHGLGFLSRYFIEYFKGLNAGENYIIAPQAPSKYYQKSDFKHVGACWLTKEETLQETENILNYLDSVFAAEEISNDKRLILLGYSQGVSVITRWLASRKINCDTLIIHSGAIPKELTPADFEFLQDTNVELWYGTEDEYLTEKRIIEETKHANNLFGNCLKIVPFAGKHVVNTDLINQLGEH